MNPKDYKKLLQDWFKAEDDKKHSMAVNYIKKNSDLIDTDLQKFIDDCPSSCKREVYKMLLKAGIDMQGYVIKDSLKQWEDYVRNVYYTIDAVDYSYN